MRSCGSYSEQCFSTRSAQHRPYARRYDLCLSGIDGHKKQVALFGQDFVQVGDFKLDLGLRYDKYNGLARNHGVQPRVGLIYNSSPLHTNFHLNYSRIFITPYNENLIVASSAGPGSISAEFGATDSAILNTGHRNQFNVGFETPIKYFSLSGEYLWKFTYGAFACRYGLV